MLVRLKSIVDRSYPLRFVDSLTVAGRKIRKEFPSAPVFVITDSAVGGLHARALLRGLSSRRARTQILVVPRGERSKSRAWKNRLEDVLIAGNVSRDSVIVALGGGVIGDLAGFTAATILRGIPYIQIPTTLLAQVDSSIGGKVAVDHPLGKNLIGAFYQPQSVYICTGVLRTLPEREYRNGLAEVLKYGAILDASFFSYLERHRGKVLRREPRTLRKIVRRCCELKRDVVERDEKEAGLRRILNFGHTIGHAVEQYSNYRLRHGEAIAIGMAAEAHLSWRRRLLSVAEYNRLKSAIAAYGLPVSIPRTYPAGSIIRLTLHDKKRSEGAVKYTLLRRIGKGLPGQEVPERVLQSAIRV